MWVMEHMADPGSIGSSCVLVLTVLLSIDACSCHEDEKGVSGNCTQCETTV